MIRIQSLQKLSEDHREQGPWGAPECLPCPPAWVHHTRGLGQDKSFNPWQNIYSLVPRAKSQREMPRARAIRSFCQDLGSRISTSFCQDCHWLGGTTAKR